MKVITKEAVKVETGLKTLEVVLQAPVAELRARARERLRKRGPLLVDGFRVGASSFSVALRGPYTICWMGAEYGNEMVSAIGVAKRNPVDRRNLSVGVTLAVYRAWRDFWMQAAQIEARRTEPCPVVVPAPGVVWTKAQGLPGQVAEVPF